MTNTNKSQESAKDGSTKGRKSFEALMFLCVIDAK